MYFVEKVKLNCLLSKDKNYYNTNVALDMFCIENMK